MRKNLTYKQQQFIKYYLLTGFNATKAVLLSKYVVSNYNSAKSIGHENLTKLYIKEAIVGEMKAGGMTVGWAANVLKEMIDAGVDKNAVASDSLKGLELLFRLHNLL
ncbi:MAG: hypothetical protein ACD_22C00205G0001 [uncultured bacterium]|nr:MAG: hypothetical protein ACD_22C00205G0001 [uncultured bacterium]